MENSIIRLILIIAILLGAIVCGYLMIKIVVLAKAQRAIHTMSRSAPDFKKDCLACAPRPEYVKTTVILTSDKNVSDFGVKIKFLKIADEPSERIEIQHKTEITFGRSQDVDIPINDSFVSRNHLKLLLANSKIQALDQGGCNGTFLNGERLVPNTLTIVSPGSTFIVGKTSFCVEPINI